MCRDMDLNRCGMCGMSGMLIRDNRVIMGLLGIMGGETIFGLAIIG